jgi:hypothetical protein
MVVNVLFNIVASTAQLAPQPATVSRAKFEVPAELYLVCMTATRDATLAGVSTQSILLQYIARARAAGDDDLVRAIKAARLHCRLQK